MGKTDLMCRHPKKDNCIFAVPHEWREGVYYCDILNDTRFEYKNCPFYKPKKDDGEEEE